jgi:cobalamin transport system permease protein
MKESGKKTFTLLILILLSLFVLMLTPFFGVETIGLKDALDLSQSSLRSEIFWSIRIPRILIAYLAGAGLALSGMAFQSMFRNPLATPFTLGVSAGASLGAAIFIKFGLVFAFMGHIGIGIFSFTGAACSIFFVYGLTRVKRGFSTSTMLLAGVAVNFFFSSLILFMQYLSDFTQSFRIIRWLMGELGTMGYDSVINLSPFVAVGCAIVIYLSNELNLLAVSEDIATSRGTDVGRTKTVLFFATSLMVGGIVSICGPIGFVGMMAPHICRLLIGADHKFLAPASLFFGGMFLTLCDTMARTIIAPAEIPVGIITAVLGGPFFIWLLTRSSVSEEIIG